MHISAFRCMHMRCILMHSNYDAFTCITVCMCILNVMLAGDQGDALPGEEGARRVHAQQCDKNRNIKAKDISNIATKIGCPEEKTTKLAKLMWICTEFLHDPHGYN